MRPATPARTHTSLPLAKAWPRGDNGQGNRESCVAYRLSKMLSVPRAVASRRMVGKQPPGRGPGCSCGGFDAQVEERAHHLPEVRAPGHRPRQTEPTVLVGTVAVVAEGVMRPDTREERRQMGSSPRYPSSSRISMRWELSGLSSDGPWVRRARPEVMPISARWLRAAPLQSARSSSTSMARIP